MLELIELLEELIGKPAIIERLPPASPDVTTTRARTGELTALIGYTPDTCLRDGMTTFVEWLRSYRGV